MTPIHARPHRSGHFPVVVVVALAAFLALPLVAQANSKNVAVLELSISGDAPAALRDLMLRSLERGLESAGFNVISSRTVRRKLRRSPDLVGCVSTSCLARLTELLGADHFVRARIEAQGAAYNFDLELLSANAEDSVVNRVQGTCPVCTLTEANESMRRTAKRLPDVPHLPDKTELLIESEPPGATAFVNDVQKGATPLTVKLEPGTYTIRLTYSDKFLPQEQEVIVNKPSDDGPQKISLTLLSATVVEHGSRYGALKWATTVGAAASIGGGVALILVDGKGTGACVNSGADRICPQVYDTQLVGLITTGVGAALAITSVIMFITDDITVDKTRVAITPTEGGAAVFVQGRF